MKSFRAANRLAVVFLKALTCSRLIVAGLASLTVTRSSGPALYGVPDFLVLHTLAAVSSSRNLAGRPASSLDAVTTVAPDDSEPGSARARA